MYTTLAHSNPGDSDSHYHRYRHIAAFWLIACFGPGLGLPLDSTMSCPVKGVPSSLSEANAKFTEDFYGKVSAENGNVFFSPVSISMAFGMVHLGARENTAAEISKALNLDKTESIHESFSKLHDIINQSLRKSQLLTANRLFSDEKYKIVSQYLEESMKFYKAELQPLDFKSPSAVTTINNWVANKTNKKIKDLISDIDPTVVLILVNAIYFKGQWKDPFEKNFTKKKPFYFNNNDSIDVDFMFQNEKYPVGFDEKTDSIILELPYSDDNLSMIIFLPKDLDGLQKLEQNLPGRVFPILCERRRKVDVLLNLPKFKFEFSLSLNSVLQSLGMKDVFAEGRANLTGIGERLFVSKAVHKAFVEVNEEGTEAAAATGIMVANCCMPPPPKYIDVDHPFLFAIVEKSSKTVLFFGRVAKPEYEK